MEDQKVEIEHHPIPDARPVQYTTPNPEPERKDADSRFSIMNMIILGAIIAVLLAIVGVGGYYLGVQKGSLPSENSMTVEVNTPSKPSPTPNATANWKIYTNEIYKFSLKYPSNLRPLISGNYAVSFVDINVDTNNRTPSNDKVTLTVNQIQRNFEKIYAVPNNQDVPDEVRSQYRLIKLKNTEFGGYKAVEFLTESKTIDQTDSRNSCGRSILIQSEANLIEFQDNLISYNTCSALLNSQTVDDMDRMLSTLKFQ